MLKTISKLRIPFFCAAIMIFSSLNAQTEKSTGRIHGIILDSGTKEPLIGANVLLINTDIGVASDSDGRFSINDVPVGNYMLKFNYIGYETAVRTDVIVRPQRITYISQELSQTSLNMDEVVVTAGFFSKVKEQPVSTIHFTNEEIRRSPGTAGDVSRIMMSLPSIAVVNDQTNNLVVRGGSPTENGFYVDNIRIPNINHWPTQGATGGPIGLLNVDFIQDVSFSSGGFPAQYGNHLSSVMDIRFREGNQEEFDGQLDWNFNGFGAVLEGPVGSNASYLVSVRRSYLDFIIKWVDLGTNSVPRYGDFQSKVVYNLNDWHKLSALVIIGDDHLHSLAKTAAAAFDYDMTYYGDQDIFESTSGINWRALWNKSGYSNTSISHTTTRFREKFFQAGTGDLLYHNRSAEKQYHLRNNNHFRLNSASSLAFGLENIIHINNFNNLYQSSVVDSAGVLKYSALKSDLNYAETSAFGQLKLTPLRFWTMTLGLRYDRQSYHSKGLLAPRFSVRYSSNPHFAIYSSGGWYSQSLPHVLLVQNDNFKSLENPRAVHLVLGTEYLLTDATRLTIEIYGKKYSKFPVDPENPGFFLIDEIYQQYGFYSYHTKLDDTGRARSYGFEIMLQKKLAHKLYGLTSLSLFKSQYQDGNGEWQNRKFDNRYIFSVEGGYKPNARWEFSLRWIYAGGTPYTPFDTAESIRQNRGILAEDRINTCRYPDYHSLNIRFDRRFLFKRSNLIFYLSFWNAYDHKNVASYYWNTKTNRQDTAYQWRFMPIFGMEYEF